MLALGWVLLTPPYGGPPSSCFFCVGCSDPVHMNDCAPLTFWHRLGAFESEADCRRARDAGIGAARNDEEWSTWQISRCFTTERVRQGPLRPDERD